MIEEATLHNVRRYRAIASLCRQAALFRPLQKSSLLKQAEDWEHLALIELESCLDQREEEETNAPAEPMVDTRWWLPRREGLFANLEA
jgi:hypothetical protein